LSRGLAHWRHRCPFSVTGVSRKKPFSVPGVPRSDPELGTRARGPSWCSLAHHAGPPQNVGKSNMGAQSYAQSAGRVREYVTFIPIAFTSLTLSTIIKKKPTACATTHFDTEHAGHQASYPPPHPRNSSRTTKAWNTLCKSQSGSCPPPCRP